jgi:hypothetical protein
VSESGDNFFRIGLLTRNRRSPTSSIVIAVNLSEREQS